MFLSLNVDFLDLFDYLSYLSEIIYYANNHFCYLNPAINIIETSLETVLHS